MLQRLRSSAIASFTLLLVACVQNPVTGESELLLVSEDWELSVGGEQYAPLRQAQGGDYVVDPQVEAYVREVGERLAAVSDRELPYEFNVVNDGTPNAWALPGGKIAINRGLLQTLESEAELAAVLGHEIVHAAAKHGARGATRGVALQAAVVAATILGDQYDYGALAQVGSSIGAQLINSRYGREAELESDRYGMEYMARAGYDPEGAIALQRKFVELAKAQRQDFLSGLFASHPPSEARVEANIETARDLDVNGGRTGRERYAEVMAPLKRDEPAYERFAEAQTALQDGDTGRARALVSEAIDIEPREGHFHSLLGDIARVERNYGGARQHYDDAIARNDDFYYYYLQRGVVKRALDDIADAERDFERSNSLLPNATAQLALGEIAEARGDRGAAERYYVAAARAGGETGERAAARLEALRGPARPRDSDESASRLVGVRTGVAGNGHFAIRLSNETTRTVGDIVLAITPPGQRTQVIPLSGTLAPGASDVLDTGQRAARAVVDRIDVRVVEARVLD